MPDLEKDPQGWWSSSTAAPTTSPAVVAPPPPKLQKTATARPSQSRYAAQPATTVVPPPVPSPSAPKSSLRATPLPPSKPKPSQSIYAATPAVAVPPNQYAPARKQAQPRVSPSFATNVNKSAIPTGPRTALPTPPVITNAPTASTSTVSPTVVVPPRELPNKNRSATGAAVREKPSSSALDEKMRLMREKNLLVQARADAVAKEQAAEAIIVAKEQAYLEMVRAKEEIERVERAERERLAEENRTKAESEKKQRGAELQARINQERKEMADRKLAKVEGRDWDREKGPGSKFREGNYYPSAQIREEKERDADGNEIMRQEELDKGVERVSGWDRVTQDEEEDDHIAAQKKEEEGLVAAVAGLSVAPEW